MEPFYSDNHIELYAKDCRQMTELADNSVQCVVTSPPYWGLRKYSGEQELIWGGNHCEHQWGEQIKRTGGAGNKIPSGFQQLSQAGQTGSLAQTKWSESGSGSFCKICGAWKGAYGLEPTPEMYVQHTIEILREIRRVLRKDGVVFLNLGDSYNSSPSNQHSNKVGGKGLENIGRQKRVLTGLYLKTEDAAWLAALVDGEGSIFIHKQIHNGKNSVYQADIQVAMKDKQCVEKAHIITGIGHLLNEKNGCWRWQVRGQQAAKVIRAIYPWLLIKREQAKIACHVADEMASRKAGFGRELNEDELNKRQYWYNLCKAINADNGIKSGLAELTPPTFNSINLKPKDMCLIPQRIAVALQSDGWWVRSVIIWSKPNPMPESVTDRPTESHEYILMLTKSAMYYWDADAVREQQLPQSIARMTRSHFTNYDPHYPNQPAQKLHFGEKLSEEEAGNMGGRNIRTVWEFPTQPYPEAHFAVFPEKLPELCIKAATPEVGCCSKCGAPWERIRKPTKDYEKALERMRRVKDRFPRPAGDWHSQHAEDDNQVAQYETLGWQPICKCNADKAPSIVLDPFAGAGTTLWVAKKLNRHAVGYEISEEYCELALERNRQQVFSLPTPPNQNLG